MKAIVCVDKNNGIGKCGKLLCSIPDDMEFFKNKTKNSIVIMGRKTLFSFKNGMPLKDRINIVLTRNSDDLKEKYKNCENLYFVGDENELDKLLDSFDKDIEVFVIGGESIYKLLVAKCDTVYVTKLFKNFEADTYFVDMEELDFEVVENSEMKEYDGIEYMFITYCKKQNIKK